jgi:hypothetical protein
MVVHFYEGDSFFFFFFSRTQATRAVARVFVTEI